MGSGVHDRAVHWPVRHYVRVTIDNLPENELTEVAHADGIARYRSIISHSWMFPVNDDVGKLQRLLPRIGKSRAVPVFEDDPTDDALVCQDKACFPGIAKVLQQMGNDAGSTPNKFLRRGRVGGAGDFIYL